MPSLGRHWLHTALTRLAKRLSGDHPAASAKTAGSGCRYTCDDDTEAAPGFERAMTDSGILLLKYWLEVSPDEQTRCLQSRINDPRKIWKLSAMDLKSYSRWYDYSRARDAMFAATDTAWAPWYIADANDKKRARLNIISHLLSRVPCKPLAHRDITLPKRQQPGDYTEPDLPLRYIPTPF